MTLYLGARQAKTFTDLHEAGEPDARDVRFDQHNNQIGRLVGEKFRSRTPDIPTAAVQIGAMCEALALTGTLVTSINDQRIQ
jgi:hypothetical protein